MSKLGQTLREFCSRFAERYGLVLVGGLAVSVRTAPRFTRDVDFTAAVANDAEAESLVYEAQRAGYVVEATLERLDRGRMATVRLRRRHEPIVDLLFAACGIEAEIAEAATSLTVLGSRVPVATVGHLIAMKLISRDPRRRPRDEEDLLALSRVADDAEWRRAADAIALIQERGFARQRDLVASLASLRSLDLGDP